MKVTREYLKQLIMEEISNLEEAPPAPAPKSFNPSEIQSLAKRIELIPKTQRVEFSEVDDLVQAIRSADAKSMEAILDNLKRMSNNTAIDKDFAKVSGLVYKNFGSEVQQLISAIKSGRMSSGASSAKPGMKAPPPPPPPGSRPPVQSSLPKRAPPPPPPPRR